MAEEHDPYWKLREPPPTPGDELCACPGEPPIVLQSHFSSNPISCLSCRSEVPPERIGFPEQLAEAVAFWRTFHDCFYHLWLDSGEFEAWARAQLEDFESPVNKRGLDIASNLNQHRRCYYWCFQDSSTDDFRPTESCPRCNQRLSELLDRRVCEPCSIVVAN